MPEPLTPTADPQPLPINPADTRRAELVRRELSETVEAQVAEAARAEHMAQMEQMRTGSGPLNVNPGDAVLEEAARQAVAAYQESSHDEDTEV